MPDDRFVPLSKLVGNATSISAPSGLLGILQAKYQRYIPNLVQDAVGNVLSLGTLMGLDDPSTAYAGASAQMVGRDTIASMMPRKTWERLSPRRIEPLHAPESESKISNIARSLRQHGWQGRPVVVIETPEGIRGLSGSHRLSASIDARRESIPVHIAAIKADAPEGVIDELISARDDFDRAALAKKYLDSTSADLLEREAVQAEKEGYRGNRASRVLYNDK